MFPNSSSEGSSRGSSINPNPSKMRRTGNRDRDREDDYDYWGVSPVSPVKLEFAKTRAASRPKTRCCERLLRRPGEPYGNRLIEERERVSLEVDKAQQKQLKALTELTSRTGMPVTQENGQRRYGPPLDPEVPVPPRGSEVFVGKIPRDCFEPDLVPVFEKAGRIYELRLMMDFSGTNRGYCFVHYYTPMEAERAIRELNGYEIRPFRKLGVVKSIDNCRLYIGGLPKDKGPEDIQEELNKLTEGVVKVICPPPPRENTGQLNRGYAFIEYESHKAAAMAKRKFVPGKILIWGTDVCVDWADPELEADSLFVRNLPPTISDGALHTLFNNHSEGGVVRVKKIKDFAFVDFLTHSQAEMAKTALDNFSLDGCELKIFWGRTDKNERLQRRGNKVRIEFIDTPRGPAPDPSNRFTPWHHSYQNFGGNNDYTYKSRDQFNNSRGNFSFSSPAKNGSMLYNANAATGGYWNQNPQMFGHAANLNPSIHEYTPFPYGFPGNPRRTEYFGPNSSSRFLPPSASSSSAAYNWTPPTPQLALVPHFADNDAIKNSSSVYNNYFSGLTKKQ